MAAAAVSVPLTADVRDIPLPGSGLISGPYADLLSSSADLGPARTGEVQLTVALRPGADAGRLTRWAARNGLSVRWRSGDPWAVLLGTPPSMAGALAVDIHDYRGRRGNVFYASPQQPAVPAALASDVSELGRLLGYTPFRSARPPLPLEVPGQGLTPSALLHAYNVAPLHEAGFTGKGQTVVVFGFDGFDQADLDQFATTFALPPFAPEVVGGIPAERSGETSMDLQAVHALAPDAKTVLVNARPTVQGAGSYEKIASLMEEVDQRYPGAVWSFSIGWGCDRLITAADLVPVRSALMRAQANGTVAFDAGGDLAGLECRGGQEWSAPPQADNAGLDAVGSIPEMTNVGGTTLSTDETGGWLAEQSWFDAPLSQGTAGGVSALYARPDWQRGIAGAPDDDSRLAPDISAVSDPFTGVRIVSGGQEIVGGGTSVAAPLWAGMAAVMNQFLLDRGGRLLGNLNPVLYRVAQGAGLPGFRDIVLGGNAVADAGPGYDLATGLGTPNVDNLARNILVQQKLVP